MDSTRFTILLPQPSFFLFSESSLPRPAISIFYLVLRALDTTEDDMTIPVGKKVTMLREFHTHLYHEDWSYSDSNERDRAVLQEFPTVSWTVASFPDSPPQLFFLHRGKKAGEWRLGTRLFDCISHSNIYSSSIPIRN